MPVSMTELEDFQQFAIETLKRRGVDSMVQLVKQWEGERELRQSAASIRESIAAADSGELVSAADAFQSARALLQDQHRGSHG